MKKISALYRRFLSAFYSRGVKANLSLVEVLAQEYYIYGKCVPNILLGGGISCSNLKEESKLI